MRSAISDALTTWLGVILLIAAVAAVLAVDIGRELLTGDDRPHRWNHVLAFVVVPLLVIAAGIATVVRVVALT